MNQSIWEHDPTHYPAKRVAQSPQQGYAVRNDHYKLVKNQWEDYDIKTNGPMPVTSIEFYRVNEREKVPRIDLERFHLLQQPLNPVEQLNFNILQANMNAITASAPPCPGDGNGDGVVDEKDVADYDRIVNHWGLSSHYDFNFDSFTNDTDLDIIMKSFGQCPRPDL